MVVSIKRHREINARGKRRKSQEARLECISLLGGRCAKCGFSDVRALQIDHVNRGGIKRYHVGGNYYQSIVRDIKRGSKDYQCLCANCNTIKARENKEFNQTVYK